MAVQGPVGTLAGAGAPGRTPARGRLSAAIAGLVIRRAPSERQRLLGVTILIGALCGLAAVAFHIAIGWVSRIAIDRALAAPGWSWIGWTVGCTTLGGLACGLLLRYVVPAARGSGVPEVKVGYARPGVAVRLRDSVGKFVVSALQIGTGASLGREGPTVHICAGLASALGRLAAISPRNVLRLLPVGAAAGIAAAFNAPIAAVTFTIEEIVGELDQTILSGVTVAAALAAVVERSVLGAHPMLAGLPAGLSVDARSFALYAALGVIAAAISIVFCDGLLWLRGRFRRARRLPTFAHPAVGALVTGVLAIVGFALLGSGGVTGGGYETLAMTLSGKLGVTVLLGLGILKLVATIFSYGSGGAGGIFAPALFIGATLGGAIGAVDVALFDHPASSLGSFALVGMGAVFAGIIRAPITSILIIIEMTNGYPLILPLMIANMTSYGLARRFRPAAIYDALLAQDGIHLGRPRRGAQRERKRVRDVQPDPVPEASFLLSTGAREMVAAAAALPRQDVFSVVDSGGRLVGVIHTADVALLASEPELGDLVRAADLARAPSAASLEQELGEVLDRMIRMGVGQLPVVDATAVVLGYIDEGAIARAFMVGRADTAGGDEPAA